MAPAFGARTRDPAISELPRNLFREGPLEAIYDQGTQDMITGKDLIELGWPRGRVIGLGLSAARALERRGESEAATLPVLEAVREDPGRAMAEDPEAFGELAREWMRLSETEVADDLREKPLPYSAWGPTSIDAATTLQMENALRLPVSVGGALMPDAHLGYGLPVGGVLATKDAVIPWAVGVDIACRLRLSVFDLSPHVLGPRKNALKEMLVRNTTFGAGKGRPESPPSTRSSTTPPGARRVSSRA